MTGKLEVMLRGAPARHSNFGKVGFSRCWTRIDAPEVLVLYLKRPRAKSCGPSDAVCGRFRYGDLKEAAPRGYGICMELERVCWQVTLLLRPL